MELRGYDAWQGQPRAVAGEGEGRGGGTSEPLGEGAPEWNGVWVGGQEARLPEGASAGTPTPTDAETPAPK